MELGHTSEQFKSHPASAEAPALLSYEDHLALHTDILAATAELRRFTPDIFKVELSGIPLHGEVPRHLYNDLGSHFEHLSFRAGKEDAEVSDSQVTLWLHGSQPRAQTALTSSPQTVEFGRNKPFDIQPYGFDAPVLTLNCDDVCLVLDYVIPDLSRRFSALVDPRTDRTFDTIAAAMGSILAENAKTKIWAQAHTVRSHDISIVHDMVYGSEIEVTLATYSAKKSEEKQDKRSCLLTVRSPIFVANGKVDQVVTYGFAEQPYIERGRVQQPFEPEATLRLESTDLSSIQLRSYIAEFQANTDARQVISRALETLLSEKAAA